MKSRWRVRTCADVDVALGHGADVARVFIVVDDLFVVGAAGVELGCG